MMKARKAEVDRTTKETKITVKLNLDSSGGGQITTGIPFFDPCFLSCRPMGSLSYQ